MITEQYRVQVSQLALTEVPLTAGHVNHPALKIHRAVQKMS